MQDISIKSTGQLVDEAITLAFKTHFAVLAASQTPQLDLRYELLRTALENRLGEGTAQLIHDLALVSAATWHSQEVLMHDKEDSVAAMSGRHAQKTNAQRNKFIQALDALLGDAGITVTSKTYG